MREYEREVELYDYIEVLFKYKWVILVTTLVFGGIGWVMRPAPSPPLYEADVVLMIKSVSPTNETSSGDIASSAQSTGFYQTLALADDLKQALIDSLGLKKKGISLIAMDGLLQVQVLDPGVKLTVRSHDPTLPIDLVNKWAELFVERNGDLNGEVASTYYKWVESQYNSTRDKLITTESELNDINNQANVRYFQVQLAALDSMATNLHRELVELDNRHQKNTLKLEMIAYLLQSNGGTLNNMSIERRDDLDRIHLATAKLDSQLKSILVDYDKKNQVEIVKSTIGIAGLDSLNREISIIERELANHKPTLGDKSNPTYVELSAKLSDLRMQYQSIKLRNSNISTSSSDKNNLAQRDIEKALSILQRREEIISRYQATKDKLKIQGNKLLESQDNSIDNYARHVSERDSLISENEMFYLRINSIKKHLKSVQNDIENIQNLSGNLYNQQRLQRDRNNLSQTLERFSKLLEEARIAREKAGGDIRTLTRALQVRQIPQEQGRHKATVAAGVGFLLSCILSLLAEYIRKAKNNRLLAQQK